MRLTLRTMLAYLDDILEPSDAQELAKKVEDSEFATGLVHRIRRSIGRLRLGAPKVLGKGGDVDPNTVAEYLDNTLPAQRVPDFETVCLESDVHLSEVASCHQVLTLVLGEPAQIDPALSERIYRIGAAPPPAPAAGTDQAESPPPASKVTASTSAEDAGPRIDTGAGLPSAEAPDYLRASRKRRLWSLVATAIFVFIAAGGLVLAVRQLGGIQTLIARVVSTAETARTAPAEPTRELPSMPPAANETMEAPAATSGHEQPALPPTDEPVPLASTLNEDEGVSSLVTAPANHTPLLDLPPEPAIPEQTPPLDAPLPWPPEPSGMASQSTEPPPPPPPAAAEAAEYRGDAWPSGPQETDTPVNEFHPTDDVPLQTDMPNLPGTDTDSPPPLAESESIEPAVVEVGNYQSTHQALVRWDEPSGAWMRLPPAAALAVGDQLAVLPTYRPQVSLVNGLVLTFSGVSGGIRIEPLVDPDTPTLAIRCGHLIVTSSKETESRISLHCGPRQQTLVLRGGPAVVAIDVQRVRIPGSDPEQTEAQTVVRTWVVQGAAQLQNEGQPATEIAAGTLCIGVDQQPGWTQPVQEVPPWIESLPLRGIDREASRWLEPALGTDRPLLLTLQEKANDRRREVQALAAECLGHFDRFDWLVHALGDPQQRSWWSAHFDCLQMALARGPEPSARVRESLLRLRGNDGELLYRLLWGFSVEDLQAGADGKLVEYLHHSSLEFRVLSIENLRRITGKTLAYNPWVSDRQRRRSVVAWQRLQKNGGIVSQAPSAIPPPPNSTSSE